VFVAIGFGLLWRAAHRTQLTAPQGGAAHAPCATVCPPP
jgi:hypothetical protein